MGTEISPQKSVSKSGGDFDKDLLLEHLLEIRALRTKLEKSLDEVFQSVKTSCQNTDIVYWAITSGSVAKTHTL
jgi:hypothetical protein